ncbi:MAG: carboxypeptidase regulatory-like domain-containing protein [Deltaproteobacteria bacterium]|nr:carboxypeptidase regulatory-like domain-containing protein [Deltaproteobacteria bacterium]
MPHRLASLLFLGVLGMGCRGMSIVGSVTDVSGQPLEDARVTIIGQLCFAPTDAQGRFDLKCAEGTYKIAIGQQGYISKEIEFDALERKIYDIGPQVLIKIPEGTGLFLFDGASYTTMEAGLVERTLEGKPPRAKSFCVLRDDSPPHAVKAGRVPIFSKRADDWNVFRLDAQGCARRLAFDGAHWSVTYSEKPDATVKDVGTEQSIHILELAAGEYFIADWRGGTFVEAKHAMEPRGLKRYSGFLLVAE